jgi:hypothetical protein
VAAVSQSFVLSDSVGNSLCRSEERKFGINEKIDISFIVILNNEIEYNMEFLSCDEYFLPNSFVML